MKIDLNNTEKKIIEILKASPKSFTELKEAGGKELQSDATLSRNLNRLQDKRLIEKFDPPEKMSNIRFRYRLSKNYYDQNELDIKKMRLQNWISSKRDSQTIFNFLRHYLEDEYPTLILDTDLINSNELLLDIYSYCKYYNLTIDKILKNPKNYIDTILFLIIHHPDQKYINLQEVIKFNSYEFQDLISEFKKNGALEEFRFIDKDSSNKNEKFYLISEDPVLHGFRQEIETIFQKFLICWELPNIKFEDNFDFLLRYSYNIIDDKLYDGDSNKNDLLQFFTQNKICLIIFIREYIFEFLNKLDLDSELEPPFKLLDFKEKDKIRSEILLSHQILNSSEKKNIEYYFYDNKIEKERRIRSLKSLIKKIAKIINENADLKNKYELEQLVYIKSHLLLLLKIFQKIDVELYDNFRKSKEILTKFPHIKLSYSYFSEEIFSDIINLEIGFGENFDYEKRSFTIRFLLERIDHLLNQFSIGRLNKSDVIEKIQKIYNIPTKYFSQNVQYPFLRKKIKIDSLGLNIFSNSEISELKKKLMSNESENAQIYEDIYLFEGVFTKKQFIYEEEKFEGWDKLLANFKDDPFRLIEYLDVFLYHSSDFNNIMKLEDLVILILNQYGIEWTLRYLNNYLNYIKWFLWRNESKNILKINLTIEREILIKIIDFIGHCIRMNIYWEYRERSSTKSFYFEANKLYTDLIDNYKFIFDRDILLSYKEKFNSLKERLQ
ncbi:MAG: hypothetical protein ACFFG0_09180 [Candidatus Thorarchaeota archaeon]